MHARMPMPNSSIVTCWSGNTGQELLPDYFAAVQGAEIITVNNAASEDTTRMLDQMREQIGGQHIKNAENAGFAAGNNQGYALASQEIIIFLNSDVAGDARFLRAVAADVKDGALYGPSMTQQLVAGRWLPYIEGWCIAATRATWERIRATRTDPDAHWPPTMLEGPWRADLFEGPYWEDNYLCIEALEKDISLIQTQWHIQHKGGRTAGPLANHGESIERNRATFAARAQAALSIVRDAATPAYARYMQQVYTQSDIQHHLPLLYSLAHGNVLELGTRTGVSTAALLAGVEAHGGHLWSVDVDERSSRVAAGHPQWTFVNGSSTDPQTLEEVGDEPFSLVLVDTEHYVEQVANELSLWGPRVASGGTICVHDPETFPGVRRAVSDFCRDRGWQVTFVLPCNGMAVIEVPG